jgi:hypothetical protein
MTQLAMPMSTVDILIVSHDTRAATNYLVWRPYFLRRACRLWMPSLRAASPPPCKPQVVALSTCCSTVWPTTLPLVKDPGCAGAPSTATSPSTWPCAPGTCLRPRRASWLLETQGCASSMEPQSQAFCLERQAVSTMKQQLLPTRSVAPTTTRMSLVSGSQAAWVRTVCSFYAMLLRIPVQPRMLKGAWGML